ncbi:MAG: WD40 repeat domain-containing protein, partial [Planctomycetaceae bacterium]|nr:WD40 repeat domain-containing protein [Planctomycetaceae bacterium]
AEAALAQAEQQLKTVTRQQAERQKSLAALGGTLEDGKLSNADSLEAPQKEAATKLVVEISAGQAELEKLQQQIAAAPAAIKAAKALAATGTKALAASVKPIAEAQAAVKAVAAELAAATKTTDEARHRLELLQQGLPVVDPKLVRQTRSWKHDRPMISCRIDSSGQYVFGGAQDPQLHRYHLLSGEAVALDGHQSWIRRFAIRPTPAGDLLVSGAYAGRLIWWDTSAAEPVPLRTVKAHQGFVRGVALSPDGTLVATCGNDLVVRIWSAETGELLHELTGHERHIYNLAFSPDGSALVSGDLTGVLKHWETGSWREVRELDAKVLSKYDKTFKADIGGIRGMDFSPDGSQLVVCGISKVSNAFAGIGEPTAVLFDFESGKQLTVMQPEPAFKGTLWSIRFHPSGRFLVGAGGSNSAMMWFWRTGQAKSFHGVKLPGVGYDLDFHPDGIRFAVALYNKEIQLFDMGPKPPAPKKKPATKEAKK